MDIALVEQHKIMDEFVVTLREDLWPEVCINHRREYHEPTVIHFVIVLRKICKVTNRHNIHRLIETIEVY